VRIRDQEIEMLAIFGSHGYEPQAANMRGAFDWLHKYQLLKKTLFHRIGNISINE
jgi:hypothetical protein